MSVTFGHAAPLALAPKFGLKLTLSPDLKQIIEDDPEDKISVQLTKLENHFNDDTDGFTATLSQNISGTRKFTLLVKNGDYDSVRIKEKRIFWLPHFPEMYQVLINKLSDYTTKLGHIQQDRRIPGDYVKK